METTIYSRADGRQHEAIHIPWYKVRDILGRAHRGTPGDDEVLAASLIRDGAPEWVRDAEGWTDEFGWGVIGPAIEKAEQTGTDQWGGTTEQTESGKAVQASALMTACMKTESLIMEPPGWGGSE